MEYDMICFLKVVNKKTEIYKKKHFILYFVKKNFYPKIAFFIIEFLEIIIVF